MKKEHIEMIKENCKVWATYTTKGGHFLIWYDATCESDFEDEGDYLMWSCDALYQFQEYCRTIEYLEATNG